MRLSNCCVPTRRVRVASLADQAIAESLAGLGWAGLAGFVGAPAATSAATASMPIDITERGSTYVITATVPGFRKEQISIEVEDGVLTIAARRATAHESSACCTPDGGCTSESGSGTTATAESAEPQVVWHRRERQALDLERRIRLGDEIDVDAISATLADGILTVTVPQRPKKQPTKVAIG